MIDRVDWLPDIYRQMEYAPTQSREMVSQVTVVIQLPGATSIVTLAKSNPEMPADGQPGSATSTTMSSSSIDRDGHATRAAAGVPLGDGVARSPGRVHRSPHRVRAMTRPSGRADRGSSRAG